MLMVVVPLSDVDCWPQPLVLSNVFVAGLIAKALVECIAVIVAYARASA